MEYLKSFLYIVADEYHYLFPYMPDEALHEIYDDILQFNVVCDGKNLNSPELLNQD